MKIKTSEKHIRDIPCYDMYDIIEYQISRFYQGVTIRWAQESAFWMKKKGLRGFLLKHNGGIFQTLLLALNFFIYFWDAHDSQKKS